MNLAVNDVHTSAVININEKHELPVYNSKNSNNDGEDTADEDDSYETVIKAMMTIMKIV